jgi:hypothetical protein
MTTALLDRFTHHCEIIETGNESWRLQKPRLTIWIRSPALVRLRNCRLRSAER